MSPESNAWARAASASRRRVAVGVVEDESAGPSPTAAEGSPAAMELQWRAVV